MKSVQVEIEFPDELLEVLNETEESFESLARTAMVLKLYEMGKLSSGTAGKVLGIPRREFLDLLGQHDISFFDDDMVKHLDEEAGHSLTGDFQHYPADCSGWHRAVGSAATDVRRNLDPRYRTP